MANKKKSGLGRGLGSLMGESAETGSPVPSLELPQAQAPAPAVEQAPVSEEAAPSAAEKPAEAVAGSTPEQGSSLGEEVAGSEYVRTEQEAKAAEEAPVTAREARPESAAPSSTTTVPSQSARGDQVKIKSIVNRDAKSEGEVPLSKVVPNPDQPRTQFKKDEGPALYELESVEVDLIPSSIKGR